MANPVNIMNGHSLATIRNSYEIQRSSRYKTKRPEATSTPKRGDYHLGQEGLWLLSIETARSMDRDDLVVGQGVSRLCRNILRRGISLDPESGDKGKDIELKEMWKEYQHRDSCSWNGEYDWKELEFLALRSVIVDGDIIFLPESNGSLKALEAHRMRTPRNTRRDVIHGVQVDDNDVPLQYWFTKEDVGLGVVRQVSSTVQIPVRNKKGRRQVFHCYFPRRFTMRRGFTALSPIDIPAGMHTDTQIAKMVQQKVASAFVLIRQMAEGMPPSRRGAITEVQQQTIEAAGISPVISVDGVNVGIEYTTGAGESVQGFSPNIPNPEYMAHAQMMLTIIAINLDLPLAVLTLDMSQHNFNSWRGAMDQAKLGFEQIGCALVNKLHAPTYEWLVDKWIREKKIKPATKTGRNDPYKHKWKLPVPPYIEPLKDAQANLMKEKSLQLSPRRINAEVTGDNFEDITVEIVEDNAYRIEIAHAKATELNKRLGLKPEEELKWQDMLSNPVLPNISGKAELAGDSSNLNNEGDGSFDNGGEG
jgi:capsid protein